MANSTDRNRDFPSANPTVPLTRGLGPRLPDMPSTGILGAAPLSRGMQMAKEVGAMRSPGITPPMKADLAKLSGDQAQRILAVVARKRAQQDV
jgi:hypothetical protein